MSKNYDSIIAGITKKIDFLKDEVKVCSDENKKIILLAQIRESEYRLLKIQEEMKGNILKPEYGDGRFASKNYSEALDMLRVHYYEYFGIDPKITELETLDLMFLDPSLPIYVNSFRVGDESHSFTLMLEYPEIYENYQSCAEYDISIKFPFELLTNKDREYDLKYLIDLVKLYSGKNANLVLFENYSQSGSLSYINLGKNITRGIDFQYIDFYLRLCDNTWFTTIYEDIASGKASIDAVEYVRKNYIDRLEFDDCFYEYLLSNKMISSGKSLLEEKNNISNYVRKLLRKET